LRIFSIVAAIWIGLLALTACGGGGGGGGGVTPETVLSGVASKGIIRGGAVKVYALNADGSLGNLLKETVTDQYGVYHADLGKYQGAVLVEASGSYTDEATGATGTVPGDVPLRAALQSVSGEVAAAVTPLTELAVQMGEDPVTHKMRVLELSSNNALIAAAFKVDILGTMPADALAASASATEEQKEHALVLAAFAGLMQSEGKDLHSVIAGLKDSIGLDKRMAVQAAVQFQAALVTFAKSAANRTGISDISATPLINIGGSTRLLTISAAGTSSLIYGLDAEVYLPPGVTVKAAADGGVPDLMLQAFGGAYVVGNYTPASASMRGRVRVALISLDGVAAGDLITLKCDIAPDAAPLDADFVLSVLDAVGKSAPLTGLSLGARLGQ
jgi:hypothetical protein